MGPQRLVIFVKAPRVGEVKTRLAKSIGAQAACAAYRQLVNLLLANLASLREVELRFTPDAALVEVQPWLREGWRARPQGGGDLGERLKHACAEHFAESVERLVIIGSDCPEVSVEDIQEAWRLLHGGNREIADVAVGSTRSPSPQPSPAGRGGDAGSASTTWSVPPDVTRPKILPLPAGEGWGEGERVAQVTDATNLPHSFPKPCDLVLGPATDGGYWLIGLRSPQSSLFDGIHWSTDSVLAETLARAKEARLTVALLRTLSDVDTAEDWECFNRAAPLE